VRYDKKCVWVIPGSTLYSCQTLMKLEFSKNPHISNFMKIRPVGAELFHADGRTDRWSDRHDEANIRSSQFCERA